MTRTRDAIAAGSRNLQWVAAIGGYPYLITNGDTAKAVAAWSGTDWTQALGGLVVQCRLSQAANPHDPFPGGGGSCLLYVQPDRTDRFGIDTHRRGAGAFTTLNATIDRNDTALAIRSNAGFDAGPAEAHIGIECIEYSSTGSTSMTVTKRGKYTAVGTKTGTNAGSGGARFADHHRITLDQNQVQSNPIISEQPRRWIGRRVDVYLHVIEADGTLNPKAEAELVWAGRIAAKADDAASGCTVLRLSHILQELATAQVARNIWGASVPEGIFIPEGLKFQLKEYDGSSLTKTANDLVVVASGATGTNQINADYYSIEQIASFMNAWLGPERDAGRINGEYTWATPCAFDVGLRTQVTYKLVNPSDKWQHVRFVLPAGIAGMLGLAPTEGIQIGGTVGWELKAYPDGTEMQRIGESVPYRTAVFAKDGPGGGLNAFKMQLEHERGEFVNTYDLMPSIIKPGLDSAKQWGLFLVDEKLLIQASYAGDGTLHDCFITPLGQSSVGDSNSQEPFYTLGRRADDDKGQVTVRQVFDLEGSFEQIMNILHYNTGTPGYNHAAYDTQAVGFGIGLPGGYLGDPFEQSIKALPRAQATMRVRFDEPTALRALIGDELLARRAFPVWKNGGIVYQRWHTPVASLASFDLTEENKIAPAGQQEDPRSPTLESDVYARPLVKFDFNPDFSFGRETRFRASLYLEDAAAIDDVGGLQPEPMTIKLRCTANQEDALALEADYLATMPMTSRPSMSLPRSLPPSLWFGIAPGDHCLVTDHFARDPLTGLRWDAATQSGGLDGRPAIVMKHDFDFGGSVPGRAHEKPRPMGGNVEVNFFDVSRGSAYGAAADIDEAQNSDGYSGGWNSTTFTLYCKQHAYSEATEDVDAASFDVGYLCRVVEKDPGDPAHPLTWQVQIQGRSGDQLELLAGTTLSGWDPAKQYRLIFDDYSSCTAVQRDSAFQADDADEMVQDVETAYHWVSTPEEDTYSFNGIEDTELVPDLAFGDGKPLDAGHERALIIGINNLIDYKTARNVLVMQSEQPIGGYAIGVWSTFFFGSIYLGRVNASAAVFRYLTVAPWFWLDDSIGATTGHVRVTISRDLPKVPAGATPSADGLVFDSFYSQAKWATTSTTPAVGIEQNLAVNVADLFWGIAYVTIECESAFCRGLAKGRETGRLLVL